MTDYVMFAPQIADYFGVTKEHALAVFTQAQHIEARTWFYCTVAWCFLVVAGAGIFGILSYITKNYDSDDLWGGIIIGAIVGAILGWVCLIVAGTFWNAMQLPEYQMYLDYIRGITMMGH